MNPNPNWRAATKVCPLCNWRTSPIRSGAKLKRHLQRVHKAVDA